MTCILESRQGTQDMNILLINLKEIEEKENELQWLHCRFVTLLMGKVIKRLTTLSGHSPWLG